MISNRMEGWNSTCKADPPMYSNETTASNQMWMRCHHLMHREWNIRNVQVKACRTSHRSMYQDLGLFPQVRHNAEPASSHRVPQTGLPPSVSLVLQMSWKSGAQLGARGGHLLRPLTHLPPLALQPSHPLLTPLCSHPLVATWNNKAILGPCPSTMPTCKVALGRFSSSQCHQSFSCKTQVLMPLGACAPKPWDFLNGPLTRSTT